MLTSLLSGGLLGVLGSIFTNLFDFFKKKQDDSQALALRKLDMEMMDKEYSYRENLATTEMETELQKSADTLVAASFAMDKSTYANKSKMGTFGNLLMVIVDFCRGITRPGLTLYMVWEVRCLRVDTESIIQAAGIQAIDTAQALAIYNNIVDMILFLACASFTWWFGTRIKQGLNKNKGA